MVFFEVHEEAIYSWTNPEANIIPSITGIKLYQNFLRNVINWGNFNIIIKRELISAKQYIIISLTACSKYNYTFLCKRMFLTFQTLVCAV